MKKFFKGFIIGLCNIIPGVCSATISLFLGVYQDLLDGLSHLFKIKFLKKHFILYLGIILGAIFGVLFLNYLYNKIPLILTLLFMGIVIRNYPVKLNDKSKIRNNKIYWILGVLIVLSMYVINHIVLSVNYEKINGVNILIIFICSFLSGLAMILPGISGALMLMVFNLYFPLLNSLTNIFNGLIRLKIPSLYDITLVFIFVVSFILSLISTSKLIKRLIKTKTIIFNSLINGMIIGSLINILLEIPNLNYNIIQLCLGIMVLIMVMIIKIPSYKQSTIQ